MAVSGGISAVTFTTAGKTRLTSGAQLGRATIASVDAEAALVGFSASPRVDNKMLATVMIAASRNMRFIEILSVI